MLIAIVFVEDIVTPVLVDVIALVIVVNVVDKCFVKDILIDNLTSIL